MTNARFFGVERSSPEKIPALLSKGLLMNSKSISKGLLLGASLFFASAAFAGEKASVRFYDAVKLNGKTIAAGKYEVELDGTGSQAQLSIRQGEETVATVPATVNPTKVAQPSTGYATSRQEDGSLSLTSVVIAGKKFTIQFGQEAASAPAKAETAGNR